MTYFRHDRSRSRDRGSRIKSDRNAILIRSRSNSPDVKIEIEQENSGNSLKNDKNNRDQPKRFESVNSTKNSNEADVVLVDEIATSAYAKTFYKSKVYTNKKAAKRPSYRVASRPYRY